MESQLRFLLAPVAVQIIREQEEDTAKKNICAYCKNELGYSDVCHHCGAVRYTGVGSLLYADKYGFADVIISLTDHYLLMQKHGSSGMATVGAVSFGALGGIVGALSDSAIHAGDQNYTGFYDLKEIKTIFHPYPLKMRISFCKS